MKILFFGDRHYKEVKPSSRIDDFRLTNKQKDEEILEIAKKEEVDLIINPGDFFDSPDISDEFFMEILKTWTSTNFIKKFNNMNLDISKNKTLDLDIDEKITPMISVIGNHDVYGADISTIANTKLGLLDYLGVNKIVSKEKPYIINTKDDLKVVVTGTSYHSKIDTPEHIDDYIIDKKLGDYHIHIVHGLLLDKKVPDDLFKHTVIDDITSTKADITLVGHDHLGFGVKEVNGKYFINPGAVLRLTADKKEIKRRPKVVIIEITKEKGIDIKEVYLKSAQAGEKVLDRSLIDQKAEKELLQDEYNKEIKKFALTQKADIYEALEITAKNELIDDKYKDDLIERTKKKEEAMSVKASANEEVYIKKLVLENFQSHENSVLNFNNGFNILIGESSTGKTSIIRAIRWIYENKPSGRDFITVGKDFAMATVYLSNDYVISRKIEKKTSGFNGYIIKDPNGNISEGNTTLLPEIQRILGFNDFIIDKDLSVPLNFMLQGESWFLIGDSYSSIDRAKIIGAVKGTHYIDAVKRDLDKENRQILSEIKKDKKESERLSKELEKFNFLDDLKQVILELEERKKKINKNLKLIEQIKSNKKIYLSYKEAIEEDEKILEDTKNISILKDNLNKINLNENNLKYLNSKRLEIKNININLLESDKIIINTEGLLNIRNSFKNLLTTTSLKDDLVNKSKDYKTYNKYLENIAITINQTQKMKEVQDRLLNIKEKEALLKNISMSKNNLYMIKDNIEKENLILDRIKEVSVFDKLNTKNIENIKLLEQLNKYKSVLRQEQTIVNEYNLLCNELATNENLAVIIDSINKTIDIKNKIINKQLEYKCSLAELEKENSVLDKINIEIENRQNQYISMLNHLDTCPTCLNKITKEQKEIIINNKIR